MAVTADKVIVEFEARLAKYNADLKSSTSLFQSSIKRQEDSIKALERQMRASSGQISANIKGIAATLAAAFSTQQLVGLLDSFTRLQNNLKVAGIEGTNLKEVQDRLYESAQKYGVGLEGLSALFGKSVQATSAFGATQEQLFTLTDAVSASLKIQGTSAEQAQGALLQLAQALQSGTVRAEEFNSINEGMFPLLQAAARGSDLWGGSVAKLRKDVIDGKVSSEQFFNAILKGAGTLEGPASKATLTLSGGLTTLTNAITVYFGEADKANGITAAFGSAMAAMAENIDTVMEALAVVATVLTARYLAGVVSATIATAALGATATGAAGAMGIMGAASFALSARLAGAATTMEAAAFAARGMGAAMMGAVGGPIGLAVLALAGGLAYLATQETYVEKTASAVKNAQNEAAQVTDKLRQATDTLANATGQARVEALANAKAVREETLQYLANAKAALAAAKAKAVQARTEFEVNKRTAENSMRYSTRDTGVLTADVSAGAVQNTTIAEKAAEAKVKKLEADVAAASKIIDTSAPKGVAAVTPGKASKRTGGSGGAGPSGPSASEIEARFNEEVSRLDQEEIRAKMQLAKGAEDRADLDAELRAVEREDRITQVQANKDYTAAQKDALIKSINALYGIPAKYDEQGNLIVSATQSLYGQVAALEKTRQIEQEIADKASAKFDADQETLDLRLAEAKTLDERRTIQLEMVDLAGQHKKAMLEAIVASQASTDAEKEIARIRLGQLVDEQKRAKIDVRNNNLSPLDAYRKQVSDVGNDINSSLEAVQVDGLQALNDGLTDAIMGAKSLGDVFKNVAKQIISDLIRIAIQQAIVAPLLQSLGASGGSSGSGFFTSILSAFGGARASGGPVSAGNAYLVGENGPEIITPRSNGMVIPNHQLKANGGGGMSQIIQVDARGAVMNDQFASMILARADQSAKGYAGAAYTSAVKAAPGAIASKKRYG